MNIELIKDFAWEWRYVIAVLIGLVIYVIFEWKAVSKLVKEHIIKARILAKDYVLKSGQEQEDWVVEKVWEILPFAVVQFFNLFGGKDMLRKVVKVLYYKIKDYLDNGILDDSWNKEGTQE